MITGQILQNNGVGEERRIFRRRGVEVEVDLCGGR
jgi:hypothetical protein